MCRHGRHARSMGYSGTAGENHSHMGSQWSAPFDVSSQGGSRHSRPRSALHGSQRRAVGDRNAEQHLLEIGIVPVGDHFRVPSARQYSRRRLLTHVTTDRTHRSACICSLQGRSTSRRRRRPRAFPAARTWRSPALGIAAYSRQTSLPLGPCCNSPSTSSKSNEVRRAEHASTA